MFRKYRRLQEEINEIRNSLIEIEQKVKDLSTISHTRKEEIVDSARIVNEWLFGEEGWKDGK